MKYCLFLNLKPLTHSICAYYSLSLRGHLCSSMNQYSFDSYSAPCTTTNLTFGIVCLRCITHRLTRGLVTPPFLSVLHPTRHGGTVTDKPLLTQGLLICDAAFSATDCKHTLHVVVRHSLFRNTLQHPSKKAGATYFACCRVSHPQMRVPEVCCSGLQEKLRHTATCKVGY